MRFEKLFYLAVPAVLLTACMQPGVDVAAEQAALRAAADAYHATAESRDVDAFVAFYTSDGVAIPPNAPQFSGADGLREFVAPFFDNPSFSITFSDMQVAVSAGGDMGYTLANASMSVDVPDGTSMQDKVRDFHLWKKEGGEWKIAIDIFNSELPLPGAPATTSTADDPVAEALSAAWPGMREGATVVDWEGNVLQEGSNGFTCLPTAPSLTGTAPLCFDGEWMVWADAWQNKKEYAAESLGISYMLAGDGGASNIDPFAEGPTEDNEWIREGAHLMVLAPAELLEEYPTDPDNGGPYVMWKSTDYAHLMIPIGSRD